ncbi:efflux RND transporter periplasmic adaptor subunit [Acidobacteria bacterium AB60]|nr:efflux RND transporter periplasmic adaptor subunit [Acidobacteria bacterium AB60]
MKKALYIVPLILCVIGGFAVGRYLAHPRTASSHQVLYYVDPMHPAYKSAKPGKAPDCGMDLVPVYADSAASAVAANDLPAGSGTEIAPGVQQLYGIRLAKAERQAQRQSMRLFGRVQAEDTRIFRVDFGADGYVKETKNDSVGTHVAKDQHLALVYSPDFLAVAGGYLAANERTPGAPNTAKDNVSTATAAQNSASVLARADRLRNLGMSDAQIEEMTQTKKLPEDVYIVSPVDGFILTRTISPGMRVERMTSLYSVADLSKVWIEAEVFGRDAQSIHPGTPATVSLPDAGQTLHASILSILPDADPVTHAVKVRLEAENPGFKLRPGMFVNVDLPVSLPEGLSVPLDAVVDSGMEKRVYVETSENRFEARSVQTGWQLGDRIQVVSGLNEGDVVVASGTFLVDSESRLHADGHASSSSAAAAPHMAKIAEHRMN